MEGLVDKGSTKMPFYPVQWLMWHTPSRLPRVTVGPSGFRRLWDRGPHRAHSDPRAGRGRRHRMDAAPDDSLHDHMVPLVETARRESNFGAEAASE